jgi:hypothetical protein
MTMQHTQQQAKLPSRLTPELVPQAKGKERMVRGCNKLCQSVGESKEVGVNLTGKSKGGHEMKVQCKETTISGTGERRQDLGQCMATTHELRSK